MNKLDKQFGEMMKGGMQADSPSSDFTLKVMARVYAEAALKPKRVLQDYQPVIGKKTWMVIIAAFVLLMVYILSSGQSAPQSGGGFWTDLLGKIAPSGTGETAASLKNGLNFFKTVPPVAYLIILSALALWTLDSVLQRLRQNSHQTKAS